MPSLVTYQLDRGVATITIDDGKANVLSFDMLAAINEALDRADADDAIVILSGRQGIFSGGFDLQVMRAGGAETARLVEEGFVLGIRLLEYRSPVIIGCTGHAVAMGSFLLLCGDYRVGVDGPFRIVANEVAIGMTMPFTAIEFCRQRLTPAAVNRAVILAEPFSPADACAAGFLDRVVPADALSATTASLANDVAGLDRHADAATKTRVRAGAIKAIREALEHDRASFATLVAAPPANGS